MTSPTVSAESAGTEIFGKSVSDLQSDVVISSNAITGTLHYVNDYTGFSSKASEQSGNYLAVKISNIPASATSVKVGLDPSAGSGLVEIINDPDKNGVFLITNKDTQSFKVVVSDGINTTTDTYSLSGLVCETV